MIVRFPRQPASHPYSFACKCAECMREHRTQVDVWRAGIRWLRAHPGQWRLPKRRKKR